jgi:hypothetical protein
MTETNPKIVVKVSVNKLKCINTNININGNNAGNVSIGNKGAAEERYLGAYSSDGGGYGGDDGYSKQGKGFDCIINNNNTNLNTVGGNVTDGNGAVEDECVLCFLEAGVTGPISITIEISNIVTLEALLDLDLDIGEELELTIFDLCELLEALTEPLTDDQLRVLIDFLGIEITAEAEVDLIDCLLEAGIIIEGV